MLLIEIIFIVMIIALIVLGFTSYKIGESTLIRASNAYEEVRALNMIIIGLTLILTATALVIFYGQIE